MLVDGHCRELRGNSESVAQLQIIAGMLTVHQNTMSQIVSKHLRNLQVDADTMVTLDQMRFASSW